LSTVHRSHFKVTIISILELDESYKTNYRILFSGFSSAYTATCQVNLCFFHLFWKRSFRDKWQSHPWMLILGLGLKAKFLGLGLGILWSLALALE